MLSSVVVVTVGVFYAFSFYSKDLPSVETLKAYEPPMVTRIHASDGEVIAQRAINDRFFLDIETIPQHVKQAFISSEDKRFHEHFGIDLIGLSRAMINNITRYLKNQRLHGASTITQQVAKNTLLSNEATLERKIKEAILALRLENNFSKNEILELYLNEIYLGSGSYGVVSASLKYFDKSLDQLTINEAAYLAALPKGPSNYHPIRKKDQALSRRNWVLLRMFEDEYITKDQYDFFVKKPLSAKIYSKNVASIPVSYFVDNLLQNIKKKTPEFDIELGGFSVRATLDSQLQHYAHKALTDGLIEYDMRHDYIMPQHNIFTDDIKKAMWKKEIPSRFLFTGKKKTWQEALVIEAHRDHIKVETQNDGDIMFHISDISWPYYRQTIQNLKKKRMKNLTEVFRAGDIILIEKKDKNTDDTTQQNFLLRQVPEIDGAIIALDPFTGRVLSLVGGFSYAKSKYNRATQAKRQPGSAIKPFIYSCALENEKVTPLQEVLDAPITFDQGANLGLWKPKNYGTGYRFYGPQPLRVGLEKSRNLMTVRLAETTGMGNVKECIEKAGVIDNLPPYLSSSLGAIEVLLIDITSAYSVFVNGGKKVAPIFVDRLQDRYGKTLYKTDKRLCEDCTIGGDHIIPKLMRKDANILNEDLAYIVNDMLQGVVKNGTGKSLLTLNYPLAGKTGTTNLSRDSWFIGFLLNLLLAYILGLIPQEVLEKKQMVLTKQGQALHCLFLKVFLNLSPVKKSLNPLEHHLTLWLFVWIKKNGK